MKILLLEDNISDADLTRRGLLKAFGECQVIIASRLAEARKILESETDFDAALFDIKLPDGSGLELLNEISEKKLKFPVIMLTGTGDEEIAVTVLKAGASDYLVKKPWFKEQLKTVIESAVKNKEKELMQRSSTINVLYVEHDQSDIDLTKRHIKSHAPNIKIEIAFTGQEAISKLQTHEEPHFDVILIDYRLHDFSALELLKILRQDLNIPVPIIVITGQGSEDVAVQAVKLGATDYITKTEKYLLKIPYVIENAHNFYLLSKSQEALRESEKQYRLLAENTGDVIFVLDMNLNYVFVSPSVIKLRGFSQEEAAKQILRDVLTEESYRNAMAMFSNILKMVEMKGPDYYAEALIELEMKRKDNTTVWTEVKASLFRDDKGKPSGIIGVTRDINEKKKMLEELIFLKEKAEESSRLKSAFLSNISHEIRTPLNGIMGFLELLNDRNLVQDEREEYTEMLMTSANRMLSTINQIIEASEIEAHTIEIFLSDTDIYEILATGYNKYRGKAEEKGINMRLEVPFKKGEVIIRTDKNKIEKIVDNLIDNAVKFTSEGEIEIGCDCTSSNLTVFIKDTGIGISETKLSEIFSGFTPADQSFSRSYEGLGLGLYIAKSYVEMLGGKIVVESEPGIGSVFQLVLPNFDGKNEFKEKSQAKIVPVRNKNDFQILITEDDDISYLYIEEILKHEGIRTVRAVTGQDAINQCNTNPDIKMVLMDIKLPEISGHEATVLIKKSRPDLVIIAQTAYAFEEDRIKALQSGCADYISKPFSKNQLIGIINKYLNL